MLLLSQIPPYYHFGKKAKRSPNDQHLIVVSSFLKTYHHIFFEQVTISAPTPHAHWVSFPKRRGEEGGRSLLAWICGICTCPQRTCETKHILAKMRELAAIMCPLDLVAIEKEREKRKEKHRDSERKKEEKAQKVREKAERERLRVCLRLLLRITCWQSKSLVPMCFRLLQCFWCCASGYRDKMGVWAGSRHTVLFIPGEGPIRSEGRFVMGGLQSLSCGVCYFQEKK